MKIYITINEENRLQGWSSTRSLETDIELDVEECHDVLLNPFIFKYINGELIKDEEYQQQLIQNKQLRENKPSLEEEVSLLKKENADLVFELLSRGILV